jgi:lipopolysaccharide export system permease protein
MKVLTRYLLRAHLGPLLFAFVALTGVILINTLAKELANLAGKGLPMSVVIEFFMLSLPANIALTLPMAVLVAVLYTFSNLAAENELTALRASGVDLRRAALPLVAVAALIAMGMVWFNDRVLPASNYRWRVLMTDVAQARPLLALREQTINPIRTADGQTPYYLEAEKIDAESGTLRRVSIYDVSDQRVSRTIVADSGRMAFNEQRTDLLLRLYDGEMQEVDFGEMSNFQTVAFREQVMRMQGVSDRIQRTAESGYRTDRDMTIGMMRTRIDTLRIELSELRKARDAQAAAAENVGEAVPLAVADPATGSEDLEIVAGAEFGAAGALDDGERPDTGGWLTSSNDVAMPPPVQGAGEPAIPFLEGVAEQDRALYETTPLQDDLILAESIRYSEARARNVEYQIREFEVEIQKKYSIAAATLVFVLLGIPIAIRFPRGGIGMVIAVSLGVFGIYYVGLIGGETLGDEGYVHPVVAMWSTNVIFGTLGLIGFMRLGREQGTNRGSGWGDLPGWLTFRRKRRIDADREEGR